MLKGNASFGSSYNNNNNNTDATDAHMRLILERSIRHKGDKK